MTCHLPEFGTGDTRSLSLGQGASGLGPGRVHPTGAFIPRNAPPLFNLSALESLFWDGRVFADAAGRVHTPAGRQVTKRMEGTFEFGALSALGLFPVLSREEMRGFEGNELARLPDSAPQATWRALMGRLARIQEYRRLFEAAYPGEAFEDMTFAHASNAMAGFTDNQFHNVAVAQFGPGQGDGPAGNDDFGRMRVTGLASDRYRFRTTPLRNVTLTGPYGHDGAIGRLRDFIEHYSESHLKLRSFDPFTLEPLLQGTLVPNAEAILATRDTILDGVVLPPELVDQLTTYMGALTDRPRRSSSGSFRPRCRAAYQSTASRRLPFLEARATDWASKGAPVAGGEVGR
jgi:cytochrome c peroxidase